MASLVAASAESAAALLARTHDATQQHARDVRESEVAQMLFACDECGCLYESQHPEVCVACGAIAGEFSLFAPFFAATPERLLRLEPQALLEQLSADPARLRDAVAAAGDAALERRAAPGEWCVKEIAGHMVDIVELACRRLRLVLEDAAVEQPERTPLPWKLLDAERYAEQPLDAVAARFERSSLELEALLAPLEPADWRKRASLVTGRTLVLDVGCWVANHNRAHLAQIIAALHQ
jgi:hypothetical protein